MAMVNCSVYDQSASIVVVPWSIYSHINDLSVEEFYSTKLICEIQKKCSIDDSVELDFTSLGKCKETLDRIGLCAPLNAAIQTFGPLLQYNIKSVSQPPTLLVDAFALMMCSYPNHHFLHI